MSLSSISFVFICQSGHLELEACVLAASLRKTLGSKAHLIAAMPLPKPVMGVVSESVIRFLESIDVQLIEFVNPLIEDRSKESVRPTALMMNKAFTLELAPDAAAVVFLDSDQVCYAALEMTSLLVPFVGRRVFYPGADAVKGVWQRAFVLCETEMPLQRQLVRSLNPSEPALVTPPYFNSGFISIHRPWVHELAGHYVDCYQRIAAHDLLGSNRYYEEQLALTITVAKTRVPYEVDNHRIDGSLFHYYTLKRLRSFRTHAKFVSELVGEFKGLGDLLRSDSDWTAVLNRR